MSGEDIISYIVVAVIIGLLAFGALGAYLRSKMDPKELEKLDRKAHSERQYKKLMRRKKGKFNAKYDGVIHVRRPK